MSGAVSFVLGLLGFGAAGGISAGQNAAENKRIARSPSTSVWDTDAATLAMRQRVRKEYYSIHDGCPNCLGKFRWEYPSGPYMHSKERNWFKAHLDAQGIPYDNEILDEVCHINFDKNQIALMYSAGKRRRWF